MIKLPVSQFVKLVVASVSVMAASATLQADSIAIANAPLSVTAGSTYSVTATYTATPAAIVQLQFFDSAWNRKYTSWVNANAGTGSKVFSVTIPSATAAGTGYLWQAILYTTAWVKITEKIVYNVTVAAASGGSGEWLPPGTWALDWSDEFSGSGAITKWFPMLGYNHVDYQSNTEKGLRWNGATESTSQMYSTKTGNHWLNGSGQMVMQVVNDKTQTNANGTKVKAAYLLSGYPASWRTGGGVNWAGKFVSPSAGPLYISARIKTDKVLGYSTWFAFWLFTQDSNSSGVKIAYDNIGSNGTEVDMFEIAKGAPSYMAKMFNVAHHWSLAAGGKEETMYTVNTTPTSTSFVDVTDTNYHIYGIEWTTTSMKCYVDGKLYKTFTTNIPSNPADMMMMLTFEYHLNLWNSAAGDGRTTGPFVSDNSSTRVMSQALIDYVRVYKK